ncbi:MAG: VOC family protein [Bacteroidia bacterium]|nr:VOC family protein [Bacteroidia bacterium]
MQQQLSFITIGVKDLDVMKNWYNHVFGWEPMKHDVNIVFYKMNGLIFALFPFEELAKDIGISPEGSGFKKFTLAINLSSEAAIDSQFEEFRKKGVAIVKSPEKVFWGGYSGYIADPENNYWEFAYNPFL